MAIEEQTLLENATLELAARSHGHFALAPASMMALVGLIQLALRHPNAGGVTAEVGREFILAVQEHFRESPNVLELIRRGDDPNYDVCR